MPRSGRPSPSTLPAPRDRKAINHEPRFKEIRRDIINWLLASKGNQRVTITKKLVLPDIEPEDLSIPRTVFNRRKTPLRRSEVKRETVEAA